MKVNKTVYLTVLTDHYENNSYILNVVVDKSLLKETVVEDFIRSIPVGSDDTYFQVYKLKLTPEQLTFLQSENDTDQEGLYNSLTEYEDDLIIDEISYDTIGDIVDYYLRKTGSTEDRDELIETKLEDDEWLEEWLGKYLEEDFGW